MRLLLATMFVGALVGTAHAEGAPRVALRSVESDADHAWVLAGAREVVTARLQRAGLQVVGEVEAQAVVVARIVDVQVSERDEGAAPLRTWHARIEWRVLDGRGEVLATSTGAGSANRNNTGRRKGASEDETLTRHAVGLAVAPLVEQLAARLATTGQGRIASR